MRKISIQTWNTFQAINIFVDDFLAEEVQVEIILVVAKWLLDLFSGSEKSQVDERGDTDNGYRTPATLVDELEGQEEEIYPNGVSDMCRVYERQRSSQDPLQRRKVVLKIRDVGIQSPIRVAIHSHPIINNTNPLCQTPENSEGKVLSSSRNLGSVLIVGAIMRFLEFSDGASDGVSLSR